MSTQTSEKRTGMLKAGDASLPLTDMEISGVITGLLHRTKVCQTFLNDHAVPLEAIYTHPLPPRASVHGFRLVVGDRIIEGSVQERGAARQAYAQAVQQGHRAALMEEERSDIFTTTVGNIAPGETVSITFELSGPLEFLQSTASLRFPLVVPEVYIPGDALGGGDVGDGVAADTDSVPDASRISPPRLPHGAANPVNLKLSFQVDPAGLKLEKVDSLCHFAKVRTSKDGLHHVSLLPGVERLDHDFVLRLQLEEGSLQTTLIQDPQSGAFALTVVPPLGAGAKSAPRDLVIVLDRSGSMQGWSMTAARRAALRIVESLTPSDRFALIAFDDRNELMDRQMVVADLRNQQMAAEFLAGVDARGGTMACPAIEQALELLKGESSSDKTILFLTDGDVGNDAELVVRSASGVRVSTVGIGQNSREGVLQSMARTSGGLCTVIPEESTLEESLRHLHQRLGRPHWMGLHLVGPKVEGQAPRFWDVWEGVPTTFFGRADGVGDEVTVEGWLASTGQHEQKVVVQQRDDLVIHRSWARARLLDLDDLWTVGKATQEELVALSVEAQVLCRFTAFAAIDLTEKVENSDQRATVVQPVEPTLAESKKMSAPVLGQIRLGSMPKPAPGGGGMLSRKRSVMPMAPMASAPAPAPCAPPPPPSLQDDQSGSLFDDSLGADAFSVPSYEAAPARYEEMDDGFRGDPFDAQPAPEPMAEKEASDRNVFHKLKDVFSPKEAVSRAEKTLAAPRTSVWQALLELLKQARTVFGSERVALLQRMADQLGQHARSAEAAQHDATIREIMSLLVDLQHQVQDGQEDEADWNTLTAVLESLA